MTRPVMSMDKLAEVAVERPAPPPAPRARATGDGFTPFGRKLLAGVEADVAAVPAGTSGKGSRHNVLLAKTIHAAAHVPTGHLPDVFVVREAMLRAAHANGYVEKYGESATLRTIDEGIARGIANPEAPPELEPRASAPHRNTMQGAPVEAIDDDAVLEEPAHLRDDDPNARKAPATNADHGVAARRPRRAVNLYDPAIVPKRPEFTVKDLIRRGGVHLVWAAPNAGKTWTLLAAMHELLVDAGRGRLFGHPEAWINRRYQRVLWIATEEEVGILRHKADAILRGFDRPALDGQLLYLFAAQLGDRITLDDLPAIIEAEGPLDAIVLDSLTGLRPKTVNGERVRWDLDNDAANEQCLRLRGLATEHGLDIFVVHHTGRDTEKGYRGPTDWWASADVMLGFVPDQGRSRVEIGKNRDGKRLPAFHLEPAWEKDAAGDDVFTLKYAGTAGPKLKLTPTALRVHAWFAERLKAGQRTASQKEIVEALGGSRGTVLDAIKRLADCGSIYDTGQKVNGSPIYGYGGGPSDSCHSKVERPDECPGVESDTDAE